MSEAQVEFQYSSAAHQAETAVDGIWLFLATEVLFFGALFFTWLICRHLHPAGFALGAEHSDLLIGSINTAILVSSSVVFAAGLAMIRLGDSRRLLQACLLTFALGLAFLILKFVEWHVDFDEHVVPGFDFRLHGPDIGGAQIFWCFYFFGTILHAVHLTIGLGAMLWLIHRTRRGDFSASYHTPVEVVGLYWSFVDLVWLTLFPLIYLIGRAA